ncbi:uncharacterized protein LOC131018916 [Salvia miltiorrhiza]|uniref:uncharacterized protein LOC131018916 n=1 Tax=Salvia miltiorrhiza TaxID=226208 RepID=UPI0025AD33AD|nr:uncharacterized protein LOC131018916 [Salvia miltiorrhiza]
MGKINDTDLKLIWGSDNVGVAERQADGNVDCCLVNIYAPQSFSDGVVLWDQISLVVEQNKDLCVCVVGDFNSIRNGSERVGRGSQFQFTDVQSFDSFIRNNNLVELPLQDRKFTWYQPQGQCKTKLDRFLVNDKWLDYWSHSKVRGLQRSVSDHVPILLETKAVFWGPKPFRFLNAWTNHQSFEQVVRESWQKSGITGWSCYVFKEKMKRLKEDLRKWNKSTFGHVEENVIQLKDQIMKWDAIDDALGLDEEEAIKRNEAEADLIIQLNNRDSLLAQKSRVRWIKEEDVNSSVFSQGN